MAANKIYVLYYTDVPHPDLGPLILPVAAYKGWRSISILGMPPNDHSVHVLGVLSAWQSVCPCCRPTPCPTTYLPHRPLLPYIFVGEQFSYRTKL